MSVLYNTFLFISGVSATSTVGAKLKLATCLDPPLPILRIMFQNEILEVEIHQVVIREIMLALPAVKH